VNIQKKFIKKTLNLDVIELRKGNDGSITEDDFKKIIHYYGFGVPAVVAASFSILRATPLSIKERTAATYLGAMTGLGDDFFDVKAYEPEKLNTLLNALLNESNYNSYTRTVERAFLFFYARLKENITQQERLKNYIKRVFEAQIKSQKQTESHISREEIIDITLEKGGLSLLLYRSTIQTEADEIEEQLLYKLGGLMQLGNDIFDVYKDYKMGIKTLITIETNIDVLHSYYLQLMNETIELAYKMNYPRKNIRSFIMFIMLGLARVFVMLEMLKKRQLKTHNVFAPEKYTRKELICDMEKPFNILRSIFYYLKY